MKNKDFWKNPSVLYFISLVIVPIIVMLVNNAFFCAGIWTGGGTLILYLENTEKGKEIIDKLF